MREVCTTTRQRNCCGPLRHKLLRSSIVGSDRVLRGGSWDNEPRNCRMANRNGNSPRNRNNDLGFRLVSVP